jgi:hypothetical protein
VRDDEVLLHAVLVAADRVVCEPLQQLQVRRRGLDVPLALSLLRPRLLVACGRDGAALTMLEG